MKNFNLYVLRQNLNNRHNPSLIPIGASHQSTTSYPQGTYNEKLTNKPNSQAQLTFNISTMCNGRHNRNADLMVNGQRLRLVFENNKKTCQDFFITKVAPAVTQDNSILTITAVDWFSYFLSHTAIGLNYDTLDYGGVKTIQELASDILRVSKVTNWKVDQELVNSKLPRFYEKQNTVQPMKISFAVSGSNCYNAIVEIAKKFDATIVPSYDWSGYGGSIDFINNNDFESNIYHLSPTVNINTFGTNQQSNNLCTVMYVKGATDAHGKDVTLTPTMHGAFKYWLLEHMCYDDAKKPTCLEHNYPILITKLFDEDTLQYTYKKYTNSLYDESGKSSLYRELNDEKDKYIGLYKKYDSREQIVFTIQVGESTDWTLKINGVATEIGSPKIVNMDDKTKALEIRLDPAIVTTGNKVKIQVVADSVWPEVEIDIIQSAWQELGSSATLNINDIWEAQDTMTAVYQLFDRDWRACTPRNDAGLYGFKSLDIGDMVSGTVYNYCKYIDEQVPSAGNFLYSFDYLLEQRLITPVEYYGLNFAFSRELRNLNLKIAIYAELYYELKYQFSSRLATIKTYLSTFLAEIDVHRESINGKTVYDEGSNYPSMLAPTPDVVTNLIKKHASDSDLIPMNSAAFTSEFIGTGLPYYTAICKNKLLEITSSILCEGLTSDFVRNCIILYGSDFFTNIDSWFSSDPNFKIFQDETNSFFDNLNNYNLILGRKDTEDQFKEFDTENIEPILDAGRSIEADTYLAQAELVRKQASYWYDASNTIYRNEPSSGKLNKDYFYHPNYREVFLNLIQEFIVTPQSPYYSYIQQASEFNLVQFYENLLQEKDELWADICERYGNFILEGTYNDSVELTTAGLYNAALLNFTKANRPIYNYSVTSIDASQLMSTGTEDIQVGDRISIHHPAVFPKPNYNKTIIHIINDKNDATLSYRIPPKGSQITSTSFERYHLVETDENASDIFDQILGSDYGTNIGKILDSDTINHDITVEWNNEWSMFAIDSLNTLNYGTTLFCGNYQGITSIKKFEDGDENTTYKAGEWLFSQSDTISETGRGYKVYQVAKDFKRSTWDKALDCMYQIDVYYGYTSLANLNNGELYLDTDKKFCQKYSELEYNEDGTPKLDAEENQIITHKGKEVVSYPVYADFIYEPEELLLTITGVTVTLRESKTQLQVQDNSLINSLVDKLLYSVRFN